MSADLVCYYNLALYVKVKDTLLYWVTQENSIEFLSTNIYLIYKLPIVHTTLF